MRMIDRLRSWWQREAPEEHTLHPWSGTPAFEAEVQERVRQLETRSPAVARQEQRATRDNAWREYREHVRTLDEPQSLMERTMGKWADRTRDEQGRGR